MDNNVVALFPGGFKPPHGGHLAIANWLADKYSKVIVIIGKKSRDNISNIKSKHIWGILPLKNNIEVIVSEDTTPIVTAYKYLFETEEPITFGLASSDKETDNRSQQFVDAIEKYKKTPTKNGNYINKNVNGVVITYSDPLVYTDRTDDNNGKYISATILRNDLKNKDFRNFATNYPNVDISKVKEIYNYLVGNMTAERREIYKKVIKEMLDNDVDNNFLNAITSTDPNEINKFITAINNNTRKYITARNNALNALKNSNKNL